MIMFGNLVSIMALMIFMETTSLAVTYQGKKNTTRVNTKF